MRMLTWELLGAAVGAGLASGREIVSFFGRYGMWGFAGIAVSAAVMALLAGADVPASWRGRLPEKLWRGVVALLLLTTGGTMLAGAGEMAGGGVRGMLGMAATLMLALWMARRTRWGLAWVSGALMAGMTLMILLVMTQPGSGTAAPPEPFLPGGLLRAAAYGGFNAAILHPLMAARQGRQRSLTAACMMIAALLTAGLAALMRQPHAMEAPMPFAQMARGMGRGAALLANAMLYLAILSTLTACLRSLPSRWAAAGVAAAATMGFAGAVEAAYPLLGGACGGMQLAMRAANFMNSRRNTFHSRAGVL